MSTAGEHGAARERVLKDLEIIDSDVHVVEPQALWDDYVEPAYRDELPLAILRKQMAPDLAARLTNPRSQAEALAETAERGEASAYGRQSTWEEQSRTKMQLPGGYDPKARLVDMDADGIDIAVIYPTQLLFWVEDPNVFGAACRAYNNWLRDYCAAAPQRLYGVGVMPLQDVKAAIGEMDRVLEMGFKAVMIRPAPTSGTRSSTSRSTSRSGGPPRPRGARSPCTRSRSVTCPRCAAVCGLTTTCARPATACSCARGSRTPST